MKDEAEQDYEVPRLNGRLVERLIFAGGFAALSGLHLSTASHEDVTKAMDQLGSQIQHLSEQVQQLSTSQAVMEARFRYLEKQEQIGGGAAH